MQHNPHHSANRGLFDLFGEGILAALGLTEPGTAPRRSPPRHRRRS